ncbi:MAG: hypothetical protein FD123_100 [Bacteroidetes bacterium]|nr:MAG: hypothetical protein FD123_100 [Bacteroidota bacterium]
MILRSASRFICFSAGAFFCAGSAFAQTDSLKSSPKIILQGQYAGKNIYIQNPYATDNPGDCCCATAVFVNHRRTKDEISKTAFMIRLDSMGLKEGDSLYIEIFHKPNCSPKVLNPDPHTRKSAFEIISISVDTSGLLQWKTKKEKGKHTYIVEQFRWNKWVKVGEVEGTGNADANSYTFRAELHSGLNQFRVKQVIDDVPCISRTVSTENNKIKAPEFKVSGNSISFAGVTTYEIYDAYGNLMLKGNGDRIDIGGLKRGGYFLNYDNRMGEFLKQ